jgi:glyoxylase-like metal-dependent hydrolase (beta-lactamase superfamily II)
MTDQLIDYHNGIFAFDAGYLRPQLAAIHLIESAGRAAFVDTANFQVLPAALTALAQRGLGPEAVDYVILTHIHLDHAGGAGVMMDAFPNAKLVVHPRGARHMIEPAKLWAGVEAVYGKERAAELYGPPRPIVAERVIAAHDNTVLRLGTKELLCIDAPGHARHHIAVVDTQARGIFTGDTFGICYRECDNAAGEPFLFPSTTPSQFDPVEMRDSVERMIALDPEAVYLAHYSRLAPPRPLAEAMLRRMDDSVRIARQAKTSGTPTRDALAAYLLAEAKTHGCTLPDEQVLELWALDIDLNAQGLDLWLNPPEH